jgi:hypothetical protein
MVFYPLQQVLGQMNGSVFYSTGKTSLFRNLSLTAMFIGIPMSFFFIAPVEYFGFNMGASGLAMKIVLTAFIGSNIKLFFSSKILSIKYVNFLRVQIIPVLILILAAWLAGLATSSVFDLKGIVYILVSGILYTMVTGVIVVFFPSALGMRKKNLLKILSEIKGFKNGI